MASNEFERLKKKCEDLFFYGCNIDSRLIEMIILPYITLRWKQVPVWLRIIAPPACGKSIHMSLLEDHKLTYGVDSFTSKSFISGFRGNNEDPSQLPLMDGKVLTISDESTIMEQNKEERNLIQAILRKSYDGKVTKAFGNLKNKVEHSAHFNILVASTPIIDRYYLYNQALGERFINYRLQIPDKVNIAVRAMQNQAGNFKVEHIRLSKLVSRYVTKICKRKFKDIRVSRKMSAVLVDCATFIALIRTHVTRDHSGRFITILPQSEVASRLIQQMIQVAVGNAIIRGEKSVTDAQIELAVYTALCSAPSLTIYMLNILWKTTKMRNRRWHTIKELMLATHLGQLSTRNVIEDLCIHRVVKMKKGKSQGGRLIQYAFTDYGLDIVKRTKLFKNYSHGLNPPKKRSKERRRHP